MKNRRGCCCSYRGRRSLCFWRLGSWLLEKKAIVQAAAVQAPRFEVDPLWPKPLPNHWGDIGATIGVSVDASDHIWIVHRFFEGSLERMEQYSSTNPPSADCCAPAPPVLEFNEAGDLLASWGGPGQGYDWPGVGTTGITVDCGCAVMSGSAATGRTLPGWPRLPAERLAAGGEPGAESGVDRALMGAAGAVNDSFVLEVHLADREVSDGDCSTGKSQGSNDTQNLRLPAKTMVDSKTNELYVADGYGNHRVIVFDADTRSYKRHLG